MAENETVVEAGNAGNVSEKTTDATDTSVESLNARIKELSDRLASEGRSKAQIKSEVDSLKEERDALKATDAQKTRRIAQIEQWYYTNVAPDDEKVRYQRAQEARQIVAAQGESKKSAVLEIILEEEDTDIRKALREAVQEAAQEGDPMGPAAVRNLRKQLTKANKSRSADTETVEKDPPLVSGNRGSGNKSSTLEDQLADAVAKKDAVQIINIRSQMSARDHQLSRG